MRTPLHLLVSIAVLALTGCQDSFGVVCTTEARPSVSVFVRDSATNEFIASGATLVQRDGAFVDSAFFPAVEPQVNSYALSTPRSMERAGVYTVTVRRAGYKDWERQGVTVTADRCHVNTVTLTARLIEEPPRVLVLSRTLGFRHASIPAGQEAIRAIGVSGGFEVETTEDPAVFTADNLRHYDAVVFLNTTGDVLDAPQQAAFESFLSAGAGSSAYTPPLTRSTIGRSTARPSARTSNRIRQSKPRRYREPRWRIRRRRHCPRRSAVRTNGTTSNCSRRRTSPCS